MLMANRMGNNTL